MNIENWGDLIVASIHVYNAGLTYAQQYVTAVETGRVFTGNFGTHPGGISVQSSPDFYYFHTGPQSGPDPAIVAEIDTALQLTCTSGLKHSQSGLHGPSVHIHPLEMKYTGFNTVLIPLPGNNTQGRLTVLAKYSNVTGESYDYDIFQQISFYNAGLGYWICNAGEGKSAAGAEIGGLSFDPAMMEELIQGLVDGLQIVNNINVEPASANVDFTAIINKMDEMIISIETSLVDIVTGSDIQDIKTVLDETNTALAELLEIRNVIATKPDLTAQLNETNRQLSLIDSRMWYMTEGGIVDLIHSLQGGGSSFDGKLKNADGTVVDLGPLLENIEESISSGAILAGDKWEPVRGFFKMLKDKWSA